MTTGNPDLVSPYWRERERYDQAQAEQRERESRLLEAIISDTEVDRVDKAYGFTEPK